VSARPAEHPEEATAAPVKTTIPEIRAAMLKQTAGPMRSPGRPAISADV